jgi:hypothetical protein
MPDTFRKRSSPQLLEREGQLASVLVLTAKMVRLLPKKIKGTSGLPRPYISTQCGDIFVQPDWLLVRYEEGPLFIWTEWPFEEHFEKIGE